MLTIINNILMRFDFSEPDTFLIEPLTDTLESIFFFEPEIFLSFSLLSSFLFIVYTYFSTDSLFKKLTITVIFNNFLMYLAVTVTILFFWQAFFMLEFGLFGFFFSFKFIVSHATMGIKGILSAATVLALYFVKSSNLKFRPYSRILPEYFLFIPETLLIVMFNFIFSLFLISITDFFAAILFLQGLTITNYFLFVGSASKTSIANALKYYFFSSWILVLLLLSAFLIYCVVGSLNFFVISNAISELFSENCTPGAGNYIRLYFHRFLAVVGCFFFFFSLFFKLGLSPLHPVTIDVCQTTPKPFLYITMVINKFVLFILLTKMSLIVFVDMFLYFRPLFFLTGVISVFYGVLQLLYTNKIKLFFAYTMLQSTGFLTLMLSFCFVNSDDFGAALSLLSGIFQYFIISFLSWGVFFYIWISVNGMLSCSWKIRKGLNYLSDFSAMGVFFKLYVPYYRTALTIALLNLIGFPPTVIFFIKFFLLLKVVSSYSIVFTLFLLFLFVLLTAKIFDIIRLFWLFYCDANVKAFYKFLGAQPRAFNINLYLHEFVCSFFAVKKTAGFLSPTDFIPRDELPELYLLTDTSFEEDSYGAFILLGGICLFHLEIEDVLEMINDLAYSFLVL